MNKLATLIIGAALGFLAADAMRRRDDIEEMKDEIAMLNGSMFEEEEDPDPGDEAEDGEPDLKIVAFGKKH